MQVYRELSQVSFDKSSVVTIGTFDGVHIGHQKIIIHLVEVANQEGLNAVVITFWPHPRQVLRPNDPANQLLFSLDEKIEALEALGVHHLVIVPFTQAFAETTASYFVEKILLNKLKCSRLVIGYDHHFGKNREGNIQFLKQMSHDKGFIINEIPPQDIDDIAVSSTKIRTALQLGNIKQANSFIGRPYVLDAEVVSGNQVGRTLEFPTANLKLLEPHKLIPATGVYAVETGTRYGSYFGMMNIGYRPTIGGEELQMEVHLFDFNHDIYGQFVRVFMHERMRDEQKFSGLQELKEQLAIDQKKVKTYFEINRP
jgi:riboflavin kinase/FMN adenylyltransferase